ncbi:HAD family hydrolase [Methylotuvimicrobium sp. KM1]|uniref:HAD family hydrolase n=1 Tax=Methylotuvimicrobium sp. KM1 TaxID=3377707 RepID=UPI00384D05C2
MKQSMIYALDFDGVICDSAVETAITGWKAAGRLWPDMTEDRLSEQLIDRFRRIRPAIETGYEAILAMRLIDREDDDRAVLNGFERNKQKLLDELNVDVDFLKKLFGETRDNWIAADFSGWIGVNPLFPSIADKLKQLNERATWYVVTTKQERFVKKILSANEIELSGDNIFGLERNRSKADTLIEILEGHPNQQIYFVEDRLPALLTVMTNPKLQSLKLQLADWGYNTAQDRQEAVYKGIELLCIEGFLKAK